MHSVTVRHTVQVAHRLMNLEGKCQAIHGHSMLVEVELVGKLNENGILEGYDFAQIKRDFRELLDTRFDHHLVLNVEDPVLAHLKLLEPALPGLTEVPNDPTVENLAMWIARSCATAYSWGAIIGAVQIRETDTNSATYFMEE